MLEMQLYKSSEYNTFHHRQKFEYKSSHEFQNMPSFCTAISSPSLTALHPPVIEARKALQVVFGTRRAICADLGVHDPLTSAFRQTGLFTVLKSFVSNEDF
jgi:hypothetical protein